MATKKKAASSVRSRMKARRGSAKPIKDDPPKPVDEHPVDTARKAHRRARRAAKKTGKRQPSPTAMEGEKPEDGWRSPGDPEARETLLSCLRNTLWRTNACTIARISHRTLEDWMAKGRARQSEIDEWDQRSTAMMEAGQGEAHIMAELGPRPEFNRYAALLQDVEMAEAKDDEVLIGVIVNKAKSGDVRAAEWLAERKRPDLYGKAVVSGHMLKRQDGAGGDSDPIAALALIVTSMQTRILEEHEDGD